MPNPNMPRRNREGIEIQLHSILTLALDGVAGCFTPGIELQYQGP